MAIKTAIGILEIDLADFWGWVLERGFAAEEVVFGVPRVNIPNDTIEIDFAESNVGDPRNTTAGKRILEQWEQARITSTTVLKGRTMQEAVADFIRKQKIGCDSIWSEIDESWDPKK